MSTKLKRVSARLYEEADGDARPFQYAKDFETLELTLHNLRLVDYAGQEGPWSEYRLGLGEDGNLENATTPPAGAQPVRLIQWRGLEADGIATDRRLLLLGADGEVGGHRARQVAVLLRGVEGETTDKLGGALTYMGPDMLVFVDRDEPFFNLELNCPCAALEPLIAALREGRLASVTLTAHVDVFQSEVERGLAEPWHMQDYLVEEEGWSMAFMTHLRGVSAPVLPPPADPEETEDLVVEPPPTPAAPPPAAPDLAPLARELRALKWLGVVALLGWWWINGA